MSGGQGNGAEGAIRAAVAAFIAAAVLTCPRDASAQVKGGLNEISGGLTLDFSKYSTDDQYTTFLQTRASYGRFVTDRLEAGPSLVMSWVEGRDANGLLGGFVDVHFGSLASRVIPFAEFSLRAGFGDPVSNPFVIGGQGGVKAFVGAGGAAIIVGPYYNYYRYDTQKNGSRALNEFGLQIGVSKYF
jgi:hypothetical protein